jgi:hypothetical protein
MSIYDWQKYVGGDLDTLMVLNVPIFNSERFFKIKTSVRNQTNSPRLVNCHKFSGEYF